MGDWKFVMRFQGSTGIRTGMDLWDHFKAFTLDEENLGLQKISELPWFAQLASGSAWLPVCFLTLGQMWHTDLISTGCTIDWCVQERSRREVRLELSLNEGRVLWRRHSGRRERVSKCAAAGINICLVKKGMRKMSPWDTDQSQDQWISQLCVTTKQLWEKESCSENLNSNFWKSVGLIN